MAEKLRIDLVPNEPRNWWRFVRSTLLILVLLGTGSALDSATMEWAGFLVLVLVVFGAVADQQRKNEGLTPDQARARIAEFEAGAR